MQGSENLSVGIAVAVFLSGSLTMVMNVRRQRSERRAGRVPKRSDRITFWVQLVLLMAIAGVVINALVFDK